MKKRSARAFFAETLALTLFFLVALALLVQVYGRARALGTQAARQSAANLILQNATADLFAGADPYAAALADCENGLPASLLVEYAANGTKQENGPYRLLITLTPETQPAGVLVQAHFELTHLTTLGSVAVLDTARYLPAATAETAKTVVAKEGSA